MGPLVYVDRSVIRAGKATELGVAARQLVEHVASSERRAISYGIYFTADRSTMTVVHIHPDSSSLEELLTLITPVLAPFRDLIRLQAIDVYGSPGDAVMAQLRAKVSLLGGTIAVHDRVAGVDAEVIGDAGPSEGR